MFKLGSKETSNVTLSTVLSLSLAPRFQASYELLYLTTLFSIIDDQYQFMISLYQLLVGFLTMRVHIHDK